MTRGWMRRTAELHGELAAVAGDDPRWWLLAGGAAVTEPWPARPGYLVSDGEPGTDTFIGYRAVPAADPLREAIDRARAARSALRELDGTLPEQPLAVTIARGVRAITEPCALDAAAFAIGPYCVIAALDDPTLPHQLAAAARGIAPPPWRGPTPFVCVSIGDDPIETARHGHRRAWRSGRGPWLGLGRTGELATVSTCHLVVDGYGHACLTGRIHALTEAAAAARGARSAGHNGTSAHSLRSALVSATNHVGAADHTDHAHHAALTYPAHPAARAHQAHRADPADHVTHVNHVLAEHHAHSVDVARAYAALPPLPPVGGAIPLGIAWQSLDDTNLRALPLAYAVGRILHRAAGRPDARFSPTLQIPVAPGRLDDPERRRCRAMAALVSVRFDAGRPEPFDVFEERARAALEREILGHGLCARLLAAVRAAPTPLTWKRRGFSTARPRWLDRISDVLGGRACLSRIRIDTPLPPSCAVSSPSRHASPDDPLGAAVVTVIDDGSCAALTVCGSGLAGTSAGARALLDEILDLAATSPTRPRVRSVAPTR